MDAPEHIIRQQERQQTIEIQQNAENTKSIGNRRKHIEELLVALGEKKPKNNGKHYTCKKILLFTAKTASLIRGRLFAESVTDLVHAPTKLLLCHLYKALGNLSTNGTVLA